MYREKSPEEIAITLGDQAELAHGSIDLPSCYWDEAERLFRWIDVDESTFREFREQFESDELKSKIDEVYEERKDFERSIEQGNSEFVSDYLEKVADIERVFYQNEVKLSDLSNINLEEERKLDSSSGADVYELDEDHVIALRGSETENLWDMRKSFRRYIRHQKVPDEINFAKVEEIGILDGRPAELIKKAPGKEVHKEDEDYERWSKLNEEMAEAPLEAYEDLVEGARILPYFNLSIDGSKSDNFFYDPEEETFTHIDNDPKRYRQHRPFHESLMAPVAAARHPGRFDASKVTEEDVENTEKILEKLRQAGDPGNLSDIETNLELLKDMGPQIDFERESPDHNYVNGILDGSDDFDNQYI